MRLLLLLILFLAASCNQTDDPQAYIPPPFQSGEYLSRNSDEYSFTVPAKISRSPPKTPWRQPETNKITKYHFRCKGCKHSPPYCIERLGEKTYLYDCDGPYHHSLPIRNGEEFIYPILIELLNEVQNTTGKPVIITSGHRCPDHNTYVDPSTGNQSSKHQIGAEVDFYISGMENSPEMTIEIIKSYYLNHPQKSLKKEYTEFLRYEKAGSNVRTAPWYNKEIFIKIYRSDEGRNKDNTFNHPYISLQVRWDEEKGERVNYSWQASNNFYRK